MRIDSHHHLWNYSIEQYGWISEEMEVLRRDFGSRELANALDSASIDGAVTVQARQTTEETDWLLDIAAQDDRILGVVGWLPLASDQIESLIEHYQPFHKLKGVRHVVQDEPDDRFILGDAFNRGVAALSGTEWVYDILIFGKHLPHTITFVDRHPQQIFVLDHIAKPTIRSAEFDSQWRENLLELAKRDNVSCKFSGVVTEVRDHEWSLELLRPYWETALEAFGPRRLMFGSDWPVCLLRSEYAQWTQTVEQLASTLSPTEQTRFWSQNAAEVYGLANAKSA